MRKVLLVEDERRMAQALEAILRQEGYEVSVCYDGITGSRAAVSGEYDGIILDVMLPGMNGFEIAGQIRKQHMDVPILMLTAKSDVDDKVYGLDCGADDYLTKPFETKELLARVRALMRRNHRGDEARQEELTVCDLVLKEKSSMLVNRMNQQEVRLSEKELHIMTYLMGNYGQILSREQLAVKIWGYDNEAEYNNVEVYISFTRRKLAFIGSEMEIKAVRGLGYELRKKNV